MAKDINNRITGPAIEAFQQLDGDLQRDIMAHLDGNPGADCYSKEDLVKAWLTWNGILGYTPIILRLVRQVFKE